MEAIDTTLRKEENTKARKIESKKKEELVIMRRRKKAAGRKGPVIRNSMEGADTNTDSQ